MNEFTIPTPPDAAFVAIHKHTGQCLGLAVEAYLGKIVVAPNSYCYQVHVWDGETSRVIRRSIIDLVWHLNGEFTREYDYKEGV